MKIGSTGKVCFKIKKFKVEDETISPPHIFAAVSVLAWE